MGTFKTKAVSAKVLTKTTSSWLKSGGTSRASSFSVGTPPASSFSTGTIKTQSSSTKAASIPTRTIKFKTVAKTPAKSIYSPTNWGKPTPYVAPKPKQGTWVAPKSGGGSSSPSGVWGGTGSIKPTTSLSSDEKMRKGITSKSYTQGADQTPRKAPSYNK